MILTVHFTIFCRYYYKHDVKVDAIFFFGYISGVLTEHVFENLHGFICTNFTMMNEKTTIFCKNVALSLGKPNLY